MTETITNTPSTNGNSALFDDHGRCLPATGERAAHHETRRHFVCRQPAIDYREIHGRIMAQLGGTLSAEEFEARATAILAKLATTHRTAKLLQGVYVPFFLPHATHPDIGSALDNHYLPAVAKSFETQFADYGFVNHHKAGLAEKLSVAARSRHQTLLETMAEGDVVGIYFPCLLEYAIPAARRQVQALPEEFLLAGGFDTCAALIGSPDLLLKKDGYPPLLWLAGLEAESENIGYHFEAYGYNLTFNRRPHLGQAAEYWASSLVVLG
jgi:hypothetical protein